MLDQKSAFLILLQCDYFSNHMKFLFGNVKATTVSRHFHFMQYSTKLKFWSKVYGCPNLWMNMGNESLNYTHLVDISKNNNNFSMLDIIMTYSHLQICVCFFIFYFFWPTKKSQNRLFLFIVLNYQYAHKTIFYYQKHPHIGWNFSCNTLQLKW